jgi:hypothetical protein
MVFGIAILGWGWRIRRLRKKWDRIREKSLKKDEPLKGNLLTRLDQVENSLRMLEERRLGRIEKARLAREVDLDLSELKEMLKMKPEEFQQAQRPVTPQRRYPQGRRLRVHSQISISL